MGIVKHWHWAQPSNQAYSHTHYVSKGAHTHVRGGDMAGPRSRYAVLFNGTLLGPMAKSEAETYMQDSSVYPEDVQAFILQPVKVRVRTVTQVSIETD